MRTVPLHPETIHGVHYIGYIDRICPSVYFRDMEIVPLYPNVVHDVHYI